MDNFLKRELKIKAPHANWSTPFALLLSFIRSYLGGACGNIKSIRRAIDLVAPLPPAVVARKLHLPRTVECFVAESDSLTSSSSPSSSSFPAVTTPYENIPRDVPGFVKAEWVETVESSSAFSGSSLCTSSSPDLLKASSFSSSSSSRRQLQPIILFLHGGGYFSCSRKTHRIFTGKLAKMLNARVLSLDYRRAPEHPFPLPLHDSIAAYLYLIQVEKYDPSQIFIMGDSAGGGLASAIMTWLKNRPQFSMPAGLVLISPFLDLTLRQPSFILNRPFDFLTGLVGDEKTVRDPKWLHSSINNNNNNNTDTSRPNRTHYYCQDDTILMHPLVSPIYATNLSTPYIPDSANQQSSSTNQQKQQQLPSILIQAGHSELFRDECIHYFSKTLPASSDVRLELYDGMVHVFHIFTLFEPMAVLAFDRIIEFVLEKMRRRSELEAASTMQQQVQENVCLHIKKTSISANNFEINSISHPYAEFVEPGIKVLDKMKLEHGIGFEDLLPKVDDFKLAAVESPTDSAYDCSDLI